MNYVDLMNLPYRERLTCRCENPFSNLVTDGITISCENDKLKVDSAIQSECEDGCDVLYGSKFSERTLLPGRDERNRVYSLVHEGLKLHEYASLLESCSNEHLKAILVAEQASALQQFDRAAGAMKVLYNISC